MKRVERVVEGVHRIGLGIVNAFLIQRGGEVTLVDCGSPGQAERIGAALRRLGCDWGNLKHILITHAHPDHVGSLAAVQRLAPQATTYMHACEATLAKQGLAFSPDRPLKPAPGLHNQLLYWAFIRPVSAQVEPARIDCQVYDGQRLPAAGGITVIHSPGHTSGHVCYLWPSSGGVLFAGDVAACFWGLTYSIAYEDFELGKQTLGELGQHPFQCVCFGHGKSILRNGDQRWARRFAPAVDAPLVPAAEGWAREATATRCGPVHSYGPVNSYGPFPQVAWSGAGRPTAIPQGSNEYAGRVVGMRSQYQLH